MNKTKIIKITFTKEQQSEIDRINRHEPVKRTTISTNTKKGYQYEHTINRPLTQEVARKRFVELYGGKCTTCPAWPAYKVMYNVGDKNQGAWLVQRYCQECYDAWKDRIRKWKKKKN